MLKIGCGSFISDGINLKLYKELIHLQGKNRFLVNYHHVKLLQAKLAGAYLAQNQRSAVWSLTRPSFHQAGDDISR